MRRKGAGYLGHYHLTDWWEHTFTRSERNYLENHLAPLLANEATWYTGTPPLTFGPSGKPIDAARFLTALAGHLKHSNQAHLAVRLLDKARRSHPDPIAEHYALLTYTEVRYKQRNTDPQAIPDVIEACLRGISIAGQVIGQMRAEHNLLEDRASTFATRVGELYTRRPFPGVPNSPFFHRLAIIYRKQGNREAAAEVENLYDTIWRPFTIDANLGMAGT